MTLRFIGCTEPFSSLTHLLGALACLCASVPLMKRAPRGSGHAFSLGIFCFACVFLLSMSGVFHLLPLGSGGRAVLQRLDHAAIFVLIAATFTPIHVVLFRGPWRWAPLLVIWTLAIAGLTLKTIYFSQIPEYLSVSVYLGMGWMGAISCWHLYQRFSFAYIRFVWWGAIAYTVGAVMDFFREPLLIPGVIGSHELFHVAILAGIFFHWKFIASLTNTAAEANAPARGVAA